MSYTYPEALSGIQKVASDYFKRALPNKRVDVRVVADSQTGTASVDWRAATYTYMHDLRVTINMPVRPAQYRMTANEFQHWAAYALHEIGHPLHTDKVVWDKAVAARQHKMLNATDDVRQEKLTIDMGLALNARDAFSALVDSLLTKAWVDGYNPNAIRSFGWTIAVLGRHANGYSFDAQPIWDALNPMGGVKLCLDWALPRLAACVTTQDCLDLSNEISAFLAKFKATEKVEDEREPEEGKDGAEPSDREPGEPAEGEDGTPEGDGDAESDDDRQSGGQGEDREPEAKGEDKPEADEDEDKPEAPKGKGSKSDGDAEDEHKPLDDTDFDDAGLEPNEMDNMTAGTMDAYVQSKVIEVMRDAMANTKQPMPIVGRAIPNCSMGMNSVQHVEAMAGKMGRQRALLARALKREEEDTFEGGRQHGRFDARRISKALQGDPHVFGRRILSEGYDTDVQILVDGSGSMSGGNIVASSVLALVVAQAARQVGVDCTAHVFTDHGLHEATKGKARPNSKKFAYMINQICGGTPLCESMVMAAKAQAKRAAGKRKIMFVITDGGCNNGPQVMKGIGEFLERQMGIEIANLHIGAAAMGCFRNECAVNVRKVGEVGLRQMTAMLERGL